MRPPHDSGQLSPNPRFPGTEPSGSDLQWHYVCSGPREELLDFVDPLVVTIWNVFQKPSINQNKQEPNAATRKITAAWLAYAPTTATRLNVTLHALIVTARPSKSSTTFCKCRYSSFSHV
jgi:hypothetical protein